MAIAVAATVATVAAAGAAAYSASQQAKAAGNAPGAPGVARWEHFYNRGTADILDEERRLVQDAVAQGNLMQPEIYALLGYEPVYDSEGPDLAGLSAKVEAAQAKYNTAKENLLRYKGRGSFPGKTKMLERLKHERNKAVKEIAQAEKELGDAQSTPRRIVGLKPLQAGPGDPTGAKDDLFRVAFNLENEALARALKGEEPVDATLRTAFDEKERVLRERLRRQLGPDYETTTAGSDALANFDRERSEAFKQYNMEATQLYAKLTSERAVDLSNLTGQRIAQLLAPQNAAIQRGTALGAVAQDRLMFTQSQQRERAMIMEGQLNKWKGEMAAAQARGAIAGAAASGLGSVAGGIGSAAGGAGGLNFGGGGATAGTSLSGILTQPATRADGLDLTR